MFSSGPGNQSPSPFSRGGGRGAPAFAHGREVHTMIMAIAGLAAIALLASMFIKGDPEKLPVAEEEELTRMELPVLDGAPPLPSAEEVADRKGQAEFLKDELQALRLRDLDPLTLAWTKLQLAEDAASPPVPQRFPVKDLMLGQVRIGTSLVLSGLVISTSPEKVGDEEWTRLVCRVFGEEDQYVIERISPGVTSPGERSE